MKKDLLTTIFLLITIATFAQSSIGKIRLRPEYYQTNLKSKDLEKLKNSKIFFVLPHQFNIDYSEDDYRKILDKAWTVGDIEIINKEEISENLEIGNTFIRFKSRSVATNNARYAFNYFKIGLVNKIKKNKKGGYTWWEDFYGVIFFTTNIEARKDMASLKDSIGGDLLDYRLGYIKNYFQQISDGIKKSNSYNIYDDFYEVNSINVLKDKKLYIPRNILYGFNALTWKERGKSAEDLFKDYTYAYEVIDENELSDKILNEEEPFYYLMYHQKNAHKIITVVESTTGRIIYRRHTKTSWNIKSKDIKALMKRINKS